jgi:putative Holliday junction resolvase
MTGSSVEGTIIAFDYGSRYLGVAVGQTVTGNARALSHLKMVDGGPPWDSIEALLQEWQPKLVVVGLPLNMDGTESEMSHRARRFANRLNGRFGVNVDHQDERLSSFEAKSQLSRGSGDRERGGVVDSLAAVVILEHWLSRQRL